MTVDYPWHVDGRGRTAATNPDNHVRDLIEQVLFTAPGERVMRPDFGAGLRALVFEPGGAAAAATAQYLVQGALERTLGDVIAVQAVEFEAVDSAIVVTVEYAVRRTGTLVVETFRAPGGGA
jgi:phage baseplate assembly protein W